VPRTNILLAAFEPISTKKLQSQTVSREKPWKSCEKAAWMMLVKFFDSFAKRIFYRITSGSVSDEEPEFLFWNKFNKKLIISFNVSFSCIEHLNDEKLNF
jgi:hypothetical protein